MESFSFEISNDQNNEQVIVYILVKKWKQKIICYCNRLIIKPKTMTNSISNSKMLFVAIYFFMRCQQKSEIQNQYQFIWTLNIPQRYEYSLQEII